VLHLPPNRLPVRPPVEIAAALLDGQDHLSPAPEAGWCLTTATAARVLQDVDGATLPHAALLQAVRRPAAPPCHVAPVPIGLPDLPAAFSSGRPFAGPFDNRAEPGAAAHAISLAETRAQRPPAPRLPADLEVVGTPPVLRPGEILALLVTRNEALRLPDALASLRRLGVDRVVVIDNGSTDGTAELARQAGAHLVRAEGSYAASNFGLTWTNAVLDAWARGHWVLVVDADEQLVYPGCEEAGLHALTAHLDGLGSEALRTVMLDLFPAGPLAGCDYVPGGRLVEAAPLFEPPRLRQERLTEFPHRLDYGGVRERLFFPEADPRRPGRWLWQRLYNLGLRVPVLRRSVRYAELAPPRSPTLTKFPLLRWREGSALIASTHRTTPLRIASIQPGGVLLHFKFLQDFHARALDAVRRGAHYDGSREYRRYLERIEREPDFSLAGPRTRVYAGPQQLVELRLMADTPAWQAARG
jgi:glycosyltransferase involved in cell wall biosynthesis